MKVCLQVTIALDICIKEKNTIFQPLGYSNPPTPPFSPPPPHRLLYFTQISIPLPPSPIPAY